ncbi:MAG TPA: c-type cytochrome [Polyangiaceae bacterium]|nr:c-type cytochrome [Polyangiaceae bacterium]
MRDPWNHKHARVCGAGGVVAIAMLVLPGCEGGRTQPFQRRMPGGDPGRGATVILAHGCGACHEIPGVRAARGRVATPLTSFAERTFIDGRLPNDPDNLVRWIMDPRSVDPQTAMPALGLTRQEASDAAAYLYTLD